jgi:1,2-diacylglycerol-3-alpha-glucose alpha-1,2-galactosyltransferase
MRVNVISESAFTVQGHGVHSAFVDTVRILRDYTDFTVYENSSKRADVVHIHTVGPYSLVKLVFSRGAKVVSAHVTPDSFVGSLVGAKYWYGLAKAYLRWFYSLADAVLAVSTEVQEQLTAMGVSKPVYLVPNTIEINNFAVSSGEKASIRKRLGIGDDQFVVMGCGQVQPRKRVDSFIDVARQLPDTAFIWVGGMPFKAAAADAGHMKELMRRKPANVTFTGSILRERVIEYYKASDVFFLPSAQETFGLVVVEAAAAGLPIVLRDLQQYRETFIDGYAMAETNDDFVEMISRLRRDRDFYSRMKGSAYTKIAKRYDGKAGASRLAEVYQETIAGRSLIKTKQSA